MERGDRMDEVMRWQEQVGRHLAAELARLRRLLEQASRSDDQAPAGGNEAAGEPDDPMTLLLRRRFREAWTDADVELKLSDF